MANFPGSQVSDPCARRHVTRKCRIFVAVGYANAINFWLAIAQNDRM